MRGDVLVIRRTRFCCFRFRSILLAKEHRGLKGLDNGAIVFWPAAEAFLCTPRQEMEPLADIGSIGAPTSFGQASRLSAA
jgi:hypothetical protein